MKKFGEIGSFDKFSWQLEPFKVFFKHNQGGDDSESGYHSTQTGVGEAAVSKTVEVTPVGPDKNQLARFADDGGPDLED